MCSNYSLRLFSPVVALANHLFNRTIGRQQSSPRTTAISTSWFIDTSTVDHAPAYKFGIMIFWKFNKFIITSLDRHDIICSSHLLLLLLLLHQQQQVVKMVNDDLYVYKKKNERISNDARRDFFVNFNTNFLLSTINDGYIFYIF